MAVGGLLADGAATDTHGTLFTEASSLLVDVADREEAIFTTIADELGRVEGA